MFVILSCFFSFGLVLALIKFLKLCSSNESDAQKIISVLGEELQGKSILLIGQGGSGKTTLARELGQLLSIPWIPLDSFAYKQGWIKCTKQQCEEQLNAKLANHRTFILEGIYIDASDKERTRELVIGELIASKRVNVVIWLNQTFWTRLGRIIKRSIKRKLGFESQGSGGAEKWFNIKQMLAKQWRTSDSTLSQMKRDWMRWHQHDLRSMMSLGFCSILYN